MTTSGYQGAAKTEGLIHQGTGLYPNDSSLEVISFGKFRFCGSALGFCRVKTGQTVQCDPALGAIVTYQKPFVLGVVTDADEGGALTANNAPEDKVRYQEI